MLSLHFLFNCLLPIFGIIKMTTHSLIDTDNLFSSENPIIMLMQYKCIRRIWHIHELYIRTSMSTN